MAAKGAFCGAPYGIAPGCRGSNYRRDNAEEYCCRCAGRLGPEEALVRAMIEEAFSGERLNKELATYTRGLRRRFRVAALTSNWSFGRTLIEKSGIAGLFDLLVLSAEEGMKKPNPEIYSVLLDRLRITPGEPVRRR